MLMIRLFRIGKKKQPSYKVVVTDKRNAPARGRFVEEIGTYNPLTKQAAFKKERVAYWLQVGAQASDTVHNLLIQNKIIEGEKRKIPFKKKVEEAAPAEAAPIAEEKPTEAPKEETAVEEAPKQEPAEEKPAEPETPKEEVIVEEKPAEEEEAVPEEGPAEEVPEETVQS